GSRADARRPSPPDAPEPRRPWTPEPSRLAPVPLVALELLAEGLHLLLQGDHLELATHDHFLELLEVEDLLLQLRLRGPQVAHDALVGAHVAQDADGADHLALGVPQCGGVERRRDDLPGGAAGSETRVPGHAAGHDLPQRGRELARL